MQIITTRIAAILLVAGTLMAISGQSAAQSTPQLHPVEAACVEFQATGPMMNGTTTRCHRDYAYEAYEIQHMQVGFGGMTQSQDQHNITIGNMIYSINLQTNTGTQTVNPLYDGLVNSMANSDSDDMTAAFLTAMGFSPNGQSKNIADTDCNVYNSAQMGMVCLTDDGLMLEQDFMGNRQVALSVSYGDGGDDENYTLYQNVPITDGPDLSNGIDIQGLIDQFGQQ